MYYIDYKGTKYQVRPCGKDKDEQMVLEVIENSNGEESTKMIPFASGEMFANVNRALAAAYKTGCRDTKEKIRKKLNL